MNQNESSIIAEQDVVPATLDGGVPFQAGSVFNNLIEWTAPGIANSEARFHFAQYMAMGAMVRRPTRRS